MIVPALLAFWILNAQPSTILAQGTAFTYQGQLQNNGALANGTYNLQFTLYTNSAGGTPVAGPVTNSAVSVGNGLLTVNMDFGPGPWNGQTNWLQIGVESNGSSSFTPLSPRQQLTPVPYAIFAENIGSGGLSAGTYGNAVTFNNAANQFSGTFTGNGAGLTNANAATLGGLGATNFWLTSGNTGTSPTNGNFLGTADVQPVEIRVGGLRGWRVEPDPRSDGAANLIGGYISNAVLQPFSGGDFIGGGGYIYGLNIISSNSSGNFIGAGSANQIGPNLNDSFIGAGGPNTILSGASVIVGGGDNTIYGDNPDSVICGGYDLEIFTNAPYSAIVGGGDIQIYGSAPYSIIGGGFVNQIYGDTNFYGTSVIAGGYSGTINSNSWNSFIGGGGGNTIGASSDHSTIVGGFGNLATGSGVFIGGGGYDGTTDSGNRALSSASVIGGGLGNVIGYYSLYSVIGGGDNNAIQNLTTNGMIAGGANNVIESGALDATIGGGADNTNNASYGTIGGGSGNAVSIAYSTIGGGAGNAINAPYATIPGGFGNVVNAAAQYSFCAGNQAQALQQGEFVWADSQFGPFAGTTANSVNFRCGGGVRFNSGSSGQQVSWQPGMGSWTFTSDRNVKDRFETVDSESVLARVSQLPILEWSYKGYPQRHIGAMAQDFHALFPLNPDDKSLNDADLHGVALAAIQGLNRKLDEQIQESKEKDTEIADLKQELDELKTEVQSLKERN